jgi:hypothetical protein
MIASKTRRARWRVRRDEWDGGEWDGGECDGGEWDGGEKDGGEKDGGEWDGGEYDGDEDATSMMELCDIVSATLGAETVETCTIRCR